MPGRAVVNGSSEGTVDNGLSKALKLTRSSS